MSIYHLAVEILKKGIHIEASERYVFDFNDICLKCYLLEYIGVSNLQIENGNRQHLVVL